MKSKQELLTNHKPDNLWGRTFDEMDREAMKNEMSHVL